VDALKISSITIREAVALPSSSLARGGPAVKTTARFFLVPRQNRLLVAAVVVVEVVEQYLQVTSVIFFLEKTVEQLH
jgi:hypothetical protein